MSKRRAKRYEGDAPTRKQGPRVALVRFYLCGDVAALDQDRREIRELCASGISRAREKLPEIRKRLLEDAQLVEQDGGERGGYWPPLTEETLARFEGRAPTTPRRRVVAASEWVAA